MKPWIKRTLFALFGVSLLVGGLSACGHRPLSFDAGMSAEDAAPYRAKMLERVASKLSLNAEQKQRLNVLADKLQAQRVALMGQSKDPRAEVKGLLAGGKFDRARAQALVSEKTAILQSKSPEVIAALADFFDSLNPAQQQQVRDFMEHRGRGHWGHRG